MEDDLIMIMSRMTATLSALAIGCALTSAASAVDQSSGVLEVDARLGYRILRVGTKQRVYLRIGLKGIHLPGDEVKRAPVNIALVIDRSGSMNGAKLDKAKDAAMMAIDRLTHRDIASIVTFSNDVTVNVPAGRIRDHALVHRMIGSLRAGGQTAIYAAVKTGANQVRTFADGGRVDRIVLLSDGLANVGPRDPYTFEALGSRLGSQRISVTTIGLGRGYNEDLMAQLAAASDGNHDFAQTADDLRRIFNREFDDVLSVIAQDIEVTIETRHGVRPLRALGRRAEISGNRARFKVAQAYAKSTHSLQLELEVDQDLALGEKELAWVSVRYRPHGNSQIATRSAKVTAKFSTDQQSIEDSLDPIVMDPVVELQAREKRRQAIKLRDAGRRDAARAALRSAQQSIGDYAKKRRRYRFKGQANIEKLEQRYAKEADNITTGDWKVQRKQMRKGLGNAAGSAVKY